MSIALAIISESTSNLSFHWHTFNNSDPTVRFACIKTVDQRSVSVGAFLRSLILGKIYPNKILTKPHTGFCFPLLIIRFGLVSTFLESTKSFGVLIAVAYS
jgi:hypothetical protein